MIARSTATSEIMSAIRSILGESASMAGKSTLPARNQGMQHLIQLLAIAGEARREDVG